MNALFSQLLRQSLAAGWVILALLLLRPLAAYCRTLARRLLLPTRGAFDEDSFRPSASLWPSVVPACTIRAGQACAGPTAPPTLAWYLASVPRPGLEALVLPGGAGPGCAALPAVWFLRVAPVLNFAPGWSFAGPWCLRLGPAPLVPCRPPGAQGGRRHAP